MGDSTRVYIFTHTYYIVISHLFVNTFTMLVKRKAANKLYRIFLFPRKGTSTT